MAKKYSDDDVTDDDVQVTDDSQSDDTSTPVVSDDVDYVDDDITPPEDDLANYNMGEIVFDGDETNEDLAVLQSSGKKDDDDDDNKKEEDEDWSGDEEFSLDDSDPFLDEADVDPEELAYDD